MIQGAELHEELACLGEGRWWWRVEPRQFGGIVDACRGQIECERGEVAFEYFRCGETLQAPVLVLRPQPVTNSGSGASGATATLVGGGA